MQFQVADSGIGMTDQQVGELFKPFSQVDASATRKHGGTGLGLTISKRLAAKLGGNITVESTPGRGSTFTLTVATGPLDGVELFEQPTETRLVAARDEKSDARPARLREAGHTGPIVALTAHAMSTHRDKCLRAGCDEYMSKPIDHGRLISLVAEHAARRHAPEPAAPCQAPPDCRGLAQK